MTRQDLLTPPEYCEYASGPCDQRFDGQEVEGIILYPSDPPQIAATIETACERLAGARAGRWRTWKQLDVAGQIIFCSICKATRISQHIVADVTTLNFNLMFEVGVALGLELPVLPIRDTTFIRDKRDFDEFGLLDTVGYLDFQNSDQLATAILDRLPLPPIPTPAADLNFDSPLYVLKGPINTEGEVRLMSSLKKSSLRFRTFDPVEIPRLSLHELRKQICASLGVIAHLVSLQRKGAIAHNARCALAAGIALSSEKTVLMLYEGDAQQPIDYRDIVKTYRVPDRVPDLTDATIRQVIDRLQSKTLRKVSTPAGLLQKLDIGDVAAENEIRPLRSYFVQTGQYHLARRGHARLVVGRKGSGKTAIFYAVRDSFSRTPARLILDLKPEGHQFTEFKEAILRHLTPGLQAHTLTAFWNIILLAEMANKIAEEEYTWAHRDPQRAARFGAVTAAYEGCGHAFTGDFSERLLKQVEHLKSRWPGKASEIITNAQVTELLYGNQIRALNDTLAEYLRDKEEVWLLVDNLDKGWPVGGSKKEDILILRTLLEATRKLQRQLERHNIAFHCLVFLRNDIYEHLIRETPDKGKDTEIDLDWSDPELFKELIRRRIVASGLINGTFEDVWGTVFDQFVGIRSSFDYLLDRTLMRPRDFLLFIHRAIETAINRGHTKVSADDVGQAELSYSEDLLKSTGFELQDVFADMSDFLYAFLGCRSVLERAQVLDILISANLTLDQARYALIKLAWFGFLGVQSPDGTEVNYSYEMRYDMRRLLAPVEGGGRFVVHPGFHAALECVA